MLGYTDKDFFSAVKPITLGGMTSPFLKAAMISTGMVVKITELTQE